MLSGKWIEAPERTAFTRAVCATLMVCSLNPILERCGPLSATNSIALHTTPGIPEHMCPVIALVAAGVEMDVLGIAYHDFTHEQRDHVCVHHPRETNFEENIIDHFRRRHYGSR